MTRIFTHGVYLKEDIPQILKTETLGMEKREIGFQLPEFIRTPLVFCSYLCEGYPSAYEQTHRPRITFETDAKEVYALPCDSFEFLRGAHWLKGYERFVFTNLKKLLERYPTAEAFKEDFQKFFRTQDPYRLYPNLSRDMAEVTFELDYCLNKNWSVGCNEIAFPKPLKIKNVKAI
jgi:hypothetical protein